MKINKVIKKKLVSKKVPAKKISLIKTTKIMEIENNLREEIKPLYIIYESLRYKLEEWEEYKKSQKEINSNFDDKLNSVSDLISDTVNSMNKIKTSISYLRNDFNVIKRDLSKLDKFEMINSVIQSDQLFKLKISEFNRAEVKIGNVVAAIAQQVANIEQKIREMDKSIEMINKNQCEY